MAAESQLSEAMELFGSGETSLTGEYMGEQGVFAERDDLLPLFRRSVFDRDIAREAGAASLHEPLALVMVDLDRFKSINDKYGHQVGDEVLKTAGEILRRIVGRKGKCYRYGGEELAVILPNYTAEEATALAERVRREIETTPIGQCEVTVTASFGIAEIPIHASTPDLLFKEADAALYEAKEIGRNCVRISGEPRPAAPAPRTAVRRVPDPRGFTEDEKEEIRAAHFRGRSALCPRDSGRLKVHEYRQNGHSPSLSIECPLCGLTADLAGSPLQSY